MNYKTWKETFVDGGAKNRLTKNSVGSIITNMKNQNVTKKYFKTATPGKGTIIFDKGYKIGSHRDEIIIAKWLRDTFGGDIHVFNERGYTSVSPDYQWDGKLWELKGPSTATSTDNAVKKALKQIYDNPGGIILDYGDHEITEEILAVVKRRIERSKLSSVDVIFLQNGKLVKIFRYKK